mmetsp:Transcript_3161/g.8917  ORF Transcript_3161/g.8917 Transcript_3161/m.8917 type:complete len:236 (+) Transcript_3161:1065-1772(+)
MHQRIPTRTSGAVPLASVRMMMAIMGIMTPATTGTSTRRRGAEWHPVRRTPNMTMTSSPAKAVLWHQHQHRHHPRDHPSPPLDHHAARQSWSEGTSTIPMTQTTKKRAEAEEVHRIYHPSGLPHEVQPPRTRPQPSRAIRRWEGKTREDEASPNRSSSNNNNNNNRHLQRSLPSLCRSPLWAPHHHHHHYRHCPKRRCGPFLHLCCSSICVQEGRIAPTSSRNRSWHRNQNRDWR